jgi:hypothetical protein
MPGSILTPNNPLQNAPFHLDPFFFFVPPRYRSSVLPNAPEKAPAAFMRGLIAQTADVRSSIAVAAFEAIAASFGQCQAFFFSIT